MYLNHLIALIGAYDFGWGFLYIYSLSIIPFLTPFCMATYHLFYSEIKHFSENYQVLYFS